MVLPLFMYSFGWEAWRRSALAEANKQQMIAAFMVREIGVQVMKFSENYVLCQVVTKIYNDMNSKQEMIDAAHRIRC